MRSRSMRRPGVATTMSGRERRSASCPFSDNPPTISEKRTSVKRPRWRPISSHWAASSRVGQRTRTRVAVMRRGRCISRSRAGSRNAAVFPEPVTADAHTSTPRSAGGITAAWIGVGAVNPSSETALRSGLESASEEKLVAAEEGSVSGSSAPSSSSSAATTAGAASSAASAAAAFAFLTFLV